MRKGIDILLVLVLGATGTACAGKDGKDGASCTVLATEAGTATISCPDGTRATVQNGAPGPAGAPGVAGEAGTSCTVEDEPGLGGVIVCSDGNSYLLPQIQVPDASGNCTVATLDGKYLLKCPDGTGGYLKDGKSCTVTMKDPATDGTRSVTIVCPGSAGQTSVTFDVGTFAVPRAIITSQPPATTTSTSAMFSFDATYPGCVFQCRLDVEPPSDNPALGLSTCLSPVTYENLSPVQHKFDVVANCGKYGLGSYNRYTWNVVADPDAGSEAAP